MIPFPFWMSKAGAVNVYITDIGGYNAAVSMGYTVGLITPAETVTGGSVVVETSINPQQPDPYQPSC